MPRDIQRTTTGGAQQRPLRPLGAVSDMSLPRMGWICVCMYDAAPDRRPDDDDGWHDGPSDDALPLCEWCGHQHIRYVHQLHHPDVPDVLEVGCVCVGRLTGEPVETVKEREKGVRNRSARRETFSQNNNWTPTADKKGIRLRHMSHIYVLKPTRTGSWSGSCMLPDETWIRPSEWSWPRDLETAKLALFDAVHPARIAV